MNFEVTKNQNQIKKRINGTNIEKIFLIAFLSVLIYQIFLPPHIGIADNGDFVRITDKVGISQGEDKKYFEYYNLTFPINFRFTIKGYQSSEFLLLLSAIGLNAILSKDGNFHLLILAGIHCLAFLSGLVFFALGSAGVFPRWKLITYILIFFFFTDVGYISYLNSIYSEPASLIFLTASIGLFVFILKVSTTRPISIKWILFFMLVGFLFVIAKPQNAAMGLFIAYITYRLTILLPETQFPLRWRRVVGYGFAFSLVGVSFLFFAFGLPRYYRSGDLWNSIFMEIIGRSESPEKDLEALGLPKAMIIYKGTNAFSEGVNRNEYELFQKSWLYFNVLRFYLLHPDRLIDLMHDSTKYAFELQQENLGNFDASSGMPPYAQSQSFAVWHNLREALLPKSIWTLIILLVVNLSAVVIKRRWIDHRIQDGLLSELHLAIIGMAVFQYLTVLMAEGTFELVKHMFLFNVLLDVCLIFLVVYFTAMISKSLSVGMNLLKWSVNR